VTIMFTNKVLVGEGDWAFRMFAIMKQNKKNVIFFINRKIFEKKEWGLGRLLVKISVTKTSQVLDTLLASRYVSRFSIRFSVLDTKSFSTSLRINFTRTDECSYAVRHFDFQ